MKVEPRTLKGFRDFLPKEARKRNYVLNMLKSVFESYGFEPLETPVLEYEEILSGKYGDEGDKLMYKFEDNGGRKVAMRYDQTVPLARAVAQYANDLPLPFKRYQIQNVYRADNTQKGRYREFLQVDIDTVGSSSPLSDAEIIICALAVVRKIGLKNPILFINDRKNFEGIDPKYISAIDKLEKIGREGVIEELRNKGLSVEQAEELMKEVEKTGISPDLKELFKYIKSQISEELPVEVRPTLARGLDYYTGPIFELVIQGEGGDSIGGGGRYDNLIGLFSGKQIPAVGFSFGFDRLIEVMENQNLFPKDLSGTKVLVTNTSDRSAQVASELRTKGIVVELYVDEKDLDKQLKYADKKQIPFVLIVEDETLTLKNMKTGEKQEITLETLPNALRQ